MPPPAPLLSPRQAPASTASCQGLAPIFPAPTPRWAGQGGPHHLGDGSRRLSPRTRPRPFPGAQLKHHTLVAVAAGLTGVSTAQPNPAARLPHPPPCNHPGRPDRTWPSPGPSLAAYLLLICLHVPRPHLTQPETKHLRPLRRLPTPRWYPDWCLPRPRAAPAASRPGGLAVMSPRSPGTWDGRGGSARPLRGRLPTGGRERPAQTTDVATSLLLHSSPSTPAGRMWAFRVWLKNFQRVKTFLPFRETKACFLAPSFPHHPAILCGQQRQQQPQGLTAANTGEGALHL